MSGYVLDACALTALLYGEDGADKVAEIIDKSIAGKAKVCMHKNNVFEVYYDSIRRIKWKSEYNILEEIYQYPISIISEISDTLLMEAGRFKIRYKMSFADSFAVASASIFNYALVTSDHHEFDAIESKENIKFFWIR